MTDLAGPRVLVVEDEALIALMMQAMLSDLGCTVVAMAHTPSEALSLIQGGAQPIDLATLDLNLGGESAQGVAAELALRGIPFIVVTGYGEARVLAPFDTRPILIKPFLEQDLATALDALSLVKGSRATG
jgi:CheY-like chemotaxis protein